MNAYCWPHAREIEHMTSAEAYDLYYGLPAPSGSEHLALIRALGDHAWMMRQEEEAGKPQRQILPMPEKAPETASAEAPPKVPAKPKFKRPQPAREEAAGGAQFFLAGIKS